MSYSGDAAEQVVRMSLNGVEVAAKISGKAAEKLAVLLYAVLKDQKRTKGKIRLTNMLRSGKPLKVFAVRDDELDVFSKAAKQYGVLYCVLKDRDANDGLTDVMVRADDASKINRIIERFGINTVDQGELHAEIEQSKDVKASGSDIPEPERNDRVKDKVDEFMEKVVPEENPNKEKTETENPTPARSGKSSPSGHSSVETGKTAATAGRVKAGAGPEKGDGNPEGRTSVRKQLDEIRRGMKDEKSKTKEPVKSGQSEHKAPKKKRKRGKEKGS